MTLYELKSRASTSELALIESVEQLVRKEYDLDLIRKKVHAELIDEMYKQVNQVLEFRGVMNSLNGKMCEFSMGDRYYMKEVLYQIGDAIRLELKPEELKDEIHRKF